MAAPTPTTRTTPAGVKLDDGFSSKITFAADPNIEFWEKAVTPPGLDGGDPVPTTTMWNERWRTKSPRQLIEMMDSSTKAAYDPIVYESGADLINVKTTITHLFPNGDTLCYYGFLQKVEFDELVEGTQPECTLTIVPTNQDPTTGVEEDPVYTAAGT